MEIKKSELKFYIGEDEENPLAEICIADKDENTLVIEHTNVSQALAGQGVAKLLVEKVVEFARKENKKVIPKCTYAKSQFEKNSDYNDVWQK